MIEKSEQIFKTEVKWMWVDENDIQCSPMHDTLSVAIRFKGNWKPFDGRQYNRKDYGSQKSPRYLRKIEIIYRFAEDEQAKVISNAFAASDIEESDQVPDNPLDQNVQPSDFS